ncbi:MAG: nitrogenase [Deltaproteobacteria bacterium]|jgi:nitrogenase molybdenum-iron protein alpha chain|nr:nitrogenase [Deltaproteobacteria bacterium]
MTEKTGNKSDPGPINLEDITCPTREQRANGITAFNGKASELVERSKAGGLRNCERDFQQNAGCILNFYLTVRVATIRDAVMIIHAPVGCSAPAALYREVYRRLYSAMNGPQDFDFHWLTTNIGEKDVIYGAADKLRFAIEEAGRRHSPEAIFILTSCASGIIGEDVEGVVGELKGKVKATLVPIHCEGIRSRVVQTGYDAFWHGILKYLVREPRKRQKDLVNVASMLSYTWQDKIEITRLLAKLGLRPNFIPEFATVEGFRSLSEAALTAPVCPTYTDYLSRGLEQEHGVPYFLYPSPIGIANTDEWLRTIGRMLGKEKEAEGAIREEKARWVPKMDQIRAGFEEVKKANGGDFRVMGSLGQGRLVTQTPFFHELGVSTPVALCQDFDDLLLEDVENLLERVGDFDIVVNTFQAAEVAHTARKYDPDMILSCPFQGSAYKREKGMTRIHALRGDGRKWSAQAGYAGAVACGSFLLQATRNRAFQNVMLEKTEDPYKDWWYRQPDPYFFHNKAAGGGS